MDKGGHMYIKRKARIFNLLKMDKGGYKCMYMNMIRRHLEETYKEARKWYI